MFWTFIGTWYDVQCNCITCGQVTQAAQFSWVSAPKATGKQLAHHQLYTNLYFICMTDDKSDLEDKLGLVCEPILAIMTGKCWCSSSVAWVTFSISVKKALHWVWKQLESIGVQNHSNASLKEWAWFAEIFCVKISLKV